MEEQFKFARQDDGYPQMTIRMGMRRHQSWIGVTKHFQQDEGAFYPHTICLSFNRFHIVTVVSRERTRLDLKPESREQMGYRITHPTS